MKLKTDLRERERERERDVFLLDLKLDLLGESE